jgi:type IV pilus assembly protein PilB
MDMGIEPFNVASALNLILAQRLVRRVCSKCAEAYKMDAAEIAGAKISGGVTMRDMHFTDMALNDAKVRATSVAKQYLDHVTLDTKMEDLPVFRGKGCEQCDGTGLKGRQGVYEVMNMTPKLRKLIMSSAGAAEIQKAAIEEGMLTLRMDGWLKVIKGITPLEQVVRETAA